MAVMTERIAAQIPALSHRRWIEIGTAENDAFIRLLESLDDEWSKDTDCPGWTVKDVAAHVLGAAEGYTQLSELRRQLLGAKRRKKDFDTQLDAMNQIQVEDRRDLAPDEVLGRLRSALPAFMKLRRRMGGIGKLVPMYDSSVLGFTNLRYLLDTIYARDVFMHRIDIARATGKPFEFLAEDSDLVADIVRDWARRTRADASLHLTGDLEQAFSMGSAMTGISVDTVELCRALSGRPTAPIPIAGDGEAATEWIHQGCPF